MCPNRMGKPQHDHVTLINGRAKAAQTYPPGLCRAVCKGLLEQMEVDEMGQFLIAEVDKDGKSDEEKIPKKQGN